MNDLIIMLILSIGSPT